MKKLLLFSIVLLTAFASCKKGGNSGPTHHDRLISLLLGTDTLNMYVGETRQVPLTINPSNYHLDSLKWKSSDTSVLSFSSTGLLTAKEIGTSTITVSNLTNTISISALVTVTPPPIDSLALGLLAYYPFTNGSTADFSGNNYNGTNSGATPTTDRFGVANNAYAFDGTGTYISVPDYQPLRLSGTDFTINIWAKLTSYGVDMLAKHITGDANGWTLGVTVAPYNGFVTFGPGGGGPMGIGSTTVTENQWHMITGIYSVNAQTFTVYIDGKYDDVTPGIPSPNSTTSAPLIIGRDNPTVPSTGYYVNGSLDDIGIYNRALSYNQIQELYNQTSTIVVSASIKQKIKK